MLRRLRSFLLATAIVATALPVTAASAAGGDYQQVIDLSFPTRSDARFSDSYDACRSGCARQHKATDLMGQKMWPLFATVAGTVCSLDDGPEDSYGRHLTVCGEDGRRYRYLHVNNDTPGTDDNAAGLEHVFAPGIREGARVARGQLVAYMGDSGNAESTAPHLHLDIFDDTVTDPYGDHRINPYPSLVAARARGDFPDGSAVFTEPADRVSGSDRVGTAIELSRAVFDRADVAVIAPATTPAEAIVAGPLAAALDAPVLTTPADRLDARVVEELGRLEVDRVVLIGDAAVHASSVRSQAGLPGEALSKLQGSDRFQTAAMVAHAVWELQGSGEPAPAEGVEGEPAGDLSGPTLVIDREGSPVVLDGSRVSGTVPVSLVGLGPLLSEIAAVGFWVDELEPDRHPDHVERHAPYDLAGTDGRRARGFDTTELADGQHTVTAIVFGPDGIVLDMVTSTFTVANDGPPPRAALVALGDHPDPSRAWPDSLMASYYGAARGRPVLLVRPDAVPPATLAAVRDASELTIVGGTAAVPQQLVDQLVEASGASVERLSGKTRYSTALAVTNDLLDRGLVGTERVWAATGGNWPDAATSGPVVARSGEALVLVDGVSGVADQETLDWLSGRRSGIAGTTAIGGTAAVAPGVLHRVARSIT